MKTFQEFQESVAIARGALKLLKSASKGAKVARTADGGRRVTSAARRARTVKPKAVPSRGPGENTWDRIDTRRSISDKVALKRQDSREVVLHRNLKKLKHGHHLIIPLR